MQRDFPKPIASGCFILINPNRFISGCLSQGKPCMTKGETHSWPDSQSAGFTPATVFNLPHKSPLTMCFAISAGNPLQERREGRVRQWERRLARRGRVPVALRPAQRQLQDAQRRGPHQVTVTASLKPIMLHQVMSSTPTVCVQTETLDNHLHECVCACVWNWTGLHDIVHTLQCPPPVCLLLEGLKRFYCFYVDRKARGGFTSRLETGLNQLSVTICNHRLLSVSHTRLPELSQKSPFEESHDGSEQRSHRKDRARTVWKWLHLLL